MSTMSSSQSNLGAARGAEENSLYGDDGENPFKLPSDELIFSFKETEKDRKIIEREKNKQLKIWEKNRPTREGCLRKICETDIEPTQLAINPKVQSKVNVAEAAGFTIPIERPKNRENRWKLIEKKREMFLVQQMLETKRDEIERLTEHATMREDGLTCSETMLETDTKAFLKFFNEIKDRTQKASKTLDETRKIKNEKTNELRQISDEIQILVSNISKNIESLEQYNSYKIFLDSLASNQEREELARMQTMKKNKLEAREQQREQNTQQMRANQQRNQQQRGQAGRRAGGNRGGGGNAGGGQAQMTADSLEADLNIPQELKAIIEDSEDEETAMPLRFTSPNELMEIFSTLEEKNLFMIQLCQDVEMQFEEKKQQEKAVKNAFSQQIDTLQQAEQSNNTRIDKTQGEKDALSGIQDNSEGKSLEPADQLKLNQECANLYRAAKQKNDFEKDKSVDQKINNSSSLTLIEETEYILNKFLDEFKFISEKFGSEFQTTSKEIRTTKRKQIREETKKEVEQKVKAIQKKRQKEKEGKKVKKVGKPLMRKIEAPAVKKVEVKKKQLTEEQMDTLNYLGLLL